MMEIEKPCISSHKHTQHVVEAISLLCTLLHCCVSKFLFCFLFLFVLEKEKYSISTLPIEEKMKIKKTCLNEQ